MLLGAAKVVVGLLFGSSLTNLLEEFPSALLGALLLVAGVELASTAARLEDNKRAWCVSTCWKITFACPLLVSPQKRSHSCAAVSKQASRQAWLPDSTTQFVVPGMCCHCHLHNGCT